MSEIPTIPVMDFEEIQAIFNIRRVNKKKG